MARRRNNDYYEPQVVNPGVVDFGQIQMYNPEDTARLAQVGQGMQQRWDASQSVIAKQLEDIGAANINPRYKADVVSKLEGDIENIYKDVNTTYQGDFGRAFDDVLKSVSKSKSLLYSAIQATAEEAKQRDIYNQMAAAGKAPVIYKRDELGRPTPKVMTFEEYHGIDKQPSFVEGKFVGPSFSTLRSAGEYEPYIERMVEHLMKQSSEQGLSKDRKYDAFLRQVKTIGQDPVALRKLFDTNQPEAQAMVEDFIRNNPTVTQEFVDEDGRLDMNLAKDFLADALVSRVRKSTDYQYMQDPYAIENLKRKRKEAQKKNILSQSSIAADIEPNAFLETKKQSYKDAIEYKMPWLAANKEYDNISDVKKLYEDELKSVAKKVSAQLEKGQLKSDIDEALNTGQSILLASLLVTAPILGSGIVLRGDTRPLNQKDIEALEYKLKELESVADDLNNARSNLEARGITTKGMSDREVADYLDKDYALRKYKQDELFISTPYGTNALTKAFNDNLLAKTSGGFRTGESKTSTTLDVLAKELNIEEADLTDQIMKSKQWNYNFNTGEFTMKVLAGKKKDKGKTIHFNLDNSTMIVSNALKEVEKVESNKESYRNKKNLTVARVPGVYEIKLTGMDSEGNPMYNIVDESGGLSELGVKLNNLNAYEIRSITKDNIINPYLNAMYGQTE